MDTSRFYGGITSLARPIDVRYASNRLALTALVAGFVLGTVLTLVLTDATVVDALLAGLGYGVGAFLAWAIGREVDPGDDRAARLAVLAYAVVAFAGRPELAAVAAVLVAVRIVARTTGRAPTPVDLAALVVLAGIAGATAAGFMAACALTLALWLDTRRDDDPHMTPQLAAAGVAFVAAFAVTLITGAFLSGWDGPTPFDAVVVIVTALAATRMRVVIADTTADLTREPLDPVRVRRGQQLAAATAAVGILWTGFQGVGALGPVLAAMVGAGAAAWLRGRP